MRRIITKFTDHVFNSDGKWIVSTLQGEWISIQDRAIINSGWFCPEHSEYRICYCSELTNLVVTRKGN